MSLRLFNTRTRSAETFTPLEAGRVRIYVCGLTPSAEAHLGHARSFLFFDVLRRFLEYSGYQVEYVQNVTDIDDRSIAASQQTGEPVAAIINRHYDAFLAAMDRLGWRKPDIEPRATAFIPQIVTMIEELVAAGFAYVSEDGVYYAVKAFPRYGELSHRNVDELLVGARIAENETKNDPLDFALWKFSKSGEPSWPAPWGEGRPGWHIECSAMARELLGTPFDIHGGGYDLIFPHHENEIAQSEALAPPGVHLANVWMHGGLLNFDGRKMSKSLGNFEPLGALLDRHDPLAVRFLFLQTGYRKPMNFTEHAIGSARTALDALALSYRQALAVAAAAAIAEPALLDALTELEADALLPAAFVHLEDDMNTAGAVGTLFRFATALNAMVAKQPPHGAMQAPIAESERTPGQQRLAALLATVATLMGILGVGEALTRAVEVAPTAQLDAAIIERLRAALGDAVHLNGDGPHAAVDAVVAARTAAKKARDFALADRLRKALGAEGIVLADSPEGTTWTVGGG